MREGDRWGGGRPKKAESMKEGRKEDEGVHGSIDRVKGEKQTICHPRALHTVIKNEYSGET